MTTTEQAVYCLTAEELGLDETFVWVDPPRVSSNSTTLPDDPYSEEEIDRATARELVRLTARDRAQKLHRGQRRGELVIPEPISLKDLLAQPDEEQHYRIAGWWPRNGRVLLSAAQKTGKTTLVGNITKSFADGDSFLSYFPIEPISGKVVVIDNEMSESMIRRWYRDIRIENSDRIILWSLRGYARAFDIVDDVVRAQLAEQLGECEASVLILDCLNPALVALGLKESDNDDAGKFLQAFDALLVEAGIGDAMIVHHMGHGAERARGASKLLGWPEVNWKYVRQRDDRDVEIDGSPRFLSAYGRDVDVAESALEFDPETRHLRFVGGNRQQHGVEQHVTVVADIVREAQEADGAYTLNTSQLKERLQSRTGVGNNEQLTRIIGAAVEQGHVHRIKQGTSRRFGHGPQPAEGAADE